VLLQEQLGQQQVLVQQQVQQRQLAWHQQRVLQVQEQQLERVLELAFLFYRKRPKQQQRSRRPKRGTCS
jgi:Holliday junction resolvase-like predicted endonuclease